jgi:hypothetical protein
MDIQTALSNYKFTVRRGAELFAHWKKVLTEFKQHFPDLSKAQATELAGILETSDQYADKYFVADLSGMYDHFDEVLLAPLLRAGIHHTDPSSNKLFLLPCSIAFGMKVVADNLSTQFKHAGVFERIGIVHLIYWLGEDEHGEAEDLHRVILEKANQSTHLIELYHYKLIYGSEVKSSDAIPDNAGELISAVKGNAEYEDLLYNKLGWK